MSTINQDGSLTVRVTKLGEEYSTGWHYASGCRGTKLKSNVQVLADKAAFALTIIAILTGILTFILARYKDAAFALERSVTVLIINASRS
ncbi:MAG: hypothetical protein U0524_01780 [Candidatus Saccharimonadales bacterium]